MFSGLRALQVIRARGEDIPFVIVSGAVGEEVAVDAMHQGADDYVLKDRLARLGPAVRRALEAKRLRDDRRRADAQLRQAAMVFESSAEGVTLTDASGAIVAVNRAFVEITGYSQDEVLGRNPRILQSGRHDESFYRDMWASLRTTGRWRGEIWNRRKDGEVYPEYLTISTVKDEQGSTTHYVGVFGDIGDVKAARQQLDFLAHHDALTGLPNRALLQDRLEQALAPGPSRPRRLVAVLLLDIDRFGKVNEGLGHGVGDGLLEAIARRLADEIEAGDTLARYVADKFVIVVEDARSVAHVARLARGYQSLARDALRRRGPRDRRHLHAWASASTRPTAPIRQRCCASPTRRCGRPGPRGGTGSAFVDVDLDVGLEERLDLERLLRGATARNELVVHYQPQVDLADRSLVGVEALVRWQHPERGLVPPGEFIQVAEEIGIIGEIGEWVLAESCRQMAAWQVDGLLVPRVAVNLSPMQLEQADFAATVRAALEAADIGAGTPRAGGHRVHDHAPVGDGRGGPGGAASARHRPGDGRLRHRPLLAGPAPAPDAAPAEDRHLVRPRHRPGPGRGGDRPGDHRHGPHPRPGDRRRGRRAGAPGRVPARRRLRHRPGLPLRPPRRRRTRCWTRGAGRERRVRSGPAP